MGLSNPAEMIADSLDPVWVASIDVDYFFEQSQNMVVAVYDIDDGAKLHDLSL